MLSTTCSRASIFFFLFWCSNLFLDCTIPSLCHAWVVSSSSSSRTLPPSLPPSSFSTTTRRSSSISSNSRSSSTSLASSTTANTGIKTSSSEADDTADDDEAVEYEYVEYDTLNEQDFAGSEWLVGTNWDSSLNKIDETWVRLAVEEKSGKNIAIWGDGNQGKWSLDVASQFFSVSKESKIGISKEIWAGVVDDYYYLQGTVRGWTFWQAASVLGQWQAKRLGVDPQEAGTPPWFLDPNDDENNDANEDDESSSS